MININGNIIVENRQLTASLFTTPINHHLEEMKIRNADADLELNFSTSLPE